MVKGTTRQVLVVKGTDDKLFDQAIFLVRDEAIAQGGVTEDALLQEARNICRNPQARISLRNRILWAVGGAVTTGLVWLLTVLL